LNLDKNNVKAFYRKGQAYMSLDLYNEAKTEFLKVLAIEPNDSNVKKSLSILKNKILVYNKKKKLVCSKFFSSNKNEKNKNVENEQEKNNHCVDGKTQDDHMNTTFIKNDTTHNNILNKSNNKNVKKLENNNNDLSNKSNVLNNNNVLNKTQNNISCIIKTKLYRLIKNNFKFFEKYSDFFFMNKIFVYLFFCFLILLFLLYLFTYAFNCYQNFYYLTLLSSLSIFSTIYCLFINVHNKHKN
ncbi:peptidyl-prolyl cis-trans isomerase, putative, partial [Hepatocystis sp. ex Piliocolobus tephrosceles]